MLAQYAVEGFNLNFSCSLGCPAPLFRDVSAAYPEPEIKQDL